MCVQSIMVSIMQAGAPGYGKPVFLLHACVAWLLFIGPQTYPIPALFPLVQITSLADLSNLNGIMAQVSLQPGLSAVFEEVRAEASTPDCDACVSAEGRARVAQIRVMVTVPGSFVACQGIAREGLTCRLCQGYVWCARVLQALTQGPWRTRVRRAAATVVLPWCARVCL